MGLVGTLWPARASPSQCAIMEAPIVFDKTCTASVQSRRQRDLNDPFSLTFLFKPHLLVWFIFYTELQICP